MDKCQHISAWKAYTKAPLPCAQCPGWVDMDRNVISVELAQQCYPDQDMSIENAARTSGTLSYAR